MALTGSPVGSAVLRDAESRLARALAGAVGPDGVARAVAATITALLGDGCCVAVRADDGRFEPRGVAHRDDAELPVVRELLGQPLGPEDGVVRALVGVGGAAVLPPEALAEGPPSAWSPLGRERPLRAVVVCPLRAQGELIGLVAMFREEPRGAYGDDEVALLEDLSSLAAIALDYARLLASERAARARAEEEAERSRRGAARLRILSEASRLFAEASFDYEGIRRIVTRRTAELLGDGCVLRLSTDEGALPAVAVHHRDPVRLPSFRELVVSQPNATPGGASGIAMQSGKSVLIPVVSASAFAPIYAREVRPGLQMTSLLVVPLRVQGRTFGTLACVRHEGGEPYGADDQALLEDLADRAALSIENARLLREAREAVRVREEFLSIAGHELRTPLTTLQLQLHALERSGPDDHKVGQRLERCRGQVERLTKLVNELVDVPRLATGRLKLRPEPVDLAELAAEVVGRFAEDGQRAGVELTVAAERVLGEWDRLRVDQVITNLVSNAIKYGAGRPVRVEARPGDACAILAVRDQGIGIAPDRLPSIFERFERGVEERSYAGFGLGLWIVRKIVEAVGGSIAVESELGRGSLFTVALPLAPPPPAGTP